MSFGLTGNINQYYLGNYYQQNKTTEKSNSVSFQSTISAKATEKVTEQTDATGMSFKDMWQTRFPGAYYHVMDASQISQGL